MTKIDTTYLQRCILALDEAYKSLQNYTPDDIKYDIYRSAVIKEFEIVLEQSGKLLKKILKPFYHTSKAVDALNFKDIFREAGLHSLIELEEVERWLVYRDNRNNTAHDYGEDLANETLTLITPFIIDSQRLLEVINTNDS
jgi:nucleotidyltransferase substrate binding protein (TIGR01987 family)